MSKIDTKLLIPLVFIIGIQTGVLIAFLVKPPAPNFDLLAFTETAMGIMVAFLAIVGAFVAAFQWSNFESRLKDTREEATKIADAVSRTTGVFVEDKLKGARDEMEIYFYEKFELINQRLKQLYIEGNHRTGSLIANRITVYYGFPPFVLSVDNAIA